MPGTEAVPRATVTDGRSSRAGRSSSRRGSGTGTEALAVAPHGSGPRWSGTDPSCRSPLVGSLNGAEAPLDVGPDDEGAVASVPPYADASGEGAAAATVGLGAGGGYGLAGVPQSGGKSAFVESSVREDSVDCGVDAVGAGHDVAGGATEAAPTAGAAGSHPLEVVAVEGQMPVDPSALLGVRDGSVARAAGSS